jgi:hypothetical protein
MKAGFLQLFGVILYSALRSSHLDVVLPPTAVGPSQPADVAPPAVLLGLGLGALVALGAVVLVVVVVAVFVIRAIKKNNAARKNS